ncbi:hypothetical protein TNIN_392701, partial [Trichonephila inaurata madagascariensis]
IITKGGVVPNVIPAESTLQIAVRSATKTELKDLTARIMECVKSGAAATGCTASIDCDERHCYESLVTNKFIGKVYDQYSSKLGRYFVPLRKKSQANQHRKRLDKFTSPDRRSYDTLPPIALVESHHPTPPRPASTQPKDNDNIMELTLHSSTNNSRPATPQDSHCRRRLALNEELKEFTFAIQTTRIMINDYKAQGITGRFLIDHQLQLHDAYKNDLSSPLRYPWLHYPYYAQLLPSYR